MFIIPGETVSFQLNYEGPLPNASTNRSNGGFSGTAKTTAGVHDNPESYDQKMRRLGLRQMVPQVCYKCQMQALNVNPSNAKNERKEFDQDVEDVLNWIENPETAKKTRKENLQWLDTNLQVLSPEIWKDYLSRHPEISSKQLGDYKVFLCQFEDEDLGIYNWIVTAMNCLQDQIDINTKNRDRRLSRLTLNVNPSNSQMVPENPT